MGTVNQDTCLAEVWAGPNSLRWLHVAGGQEGVCFWLRWAAGPVSTAQTHLPGAVRPPLCR